MEAPRVSEDVDHDPGTGYSREVREGAVALVCEQVGQYASRWEA